MNRLMNLNTLIAFTAVAREGSVSQAAEALNLTQPAISHQIKRLTEETGVTLFERTPKGLKITPEGAKLLARAQNVLSALTDFQLSAQRNSGKISGKLSIGTIVDPGFIRLGQFLVKLVETHPDLQIELSHGISGDVLKKIERKQLDVGFFLSGPNPNSSPHGNIDVETPSSFHFVELAKFNYRMVAPAGWDAKIKDLSWPQLAQLPWIGTPPNSAHNRILNVFLKKHKCELNIVALVDQEASMLEMVKSGMGLSLCREAIALSEQQSHGIAVSDHIFAPAVLSFAVPKSRLADPVVQAALSLLSEVWGS